MYLKSKRHQNKTFSFKNENMKRLREDMYGVQEEVLWFEISVYYFVAVTVFHSGDNLLEQAAPLIL